MRSKQEPEARRSIEAQAIAEGTRLRRLPAASADLLRNEIQHGDLRGEAHRPSPAIWSAIARRRGCIIYPAIDRVAPFAEIAPASGRMCNHQHLPSEGRR